MYIQLIFNLIEVGTRNGTQWTIRAHNVGDLYWEARWAWKPATKTASRMQMKAEDVAGYFLRHPMIPHLVEEVKYTHDRKHPISNNHQKVPPVSPSAPKTTISFFRITGLSSRELGGRLKQFGCGQNTQPFHRLVKARAIEVSTLEKICAIELNLSFDEVWTIVETCAPNETYLFDEICPHKKFRASHGNSTIEEDSVLNVFFAFDEVHAFAKVCAHDDTCSINEGCAFQEFFAYDEVLSTDKAHSLERTCTLDECRTIVESCVHGKVLALEESNASVMGSVSAELFVFGGIVLLKKVCIQFDTTRVDRVPDEIYAFDESCELDEVRESDENRALNEALFFVKSCAFEKAHAFEVTCAFGEMCVFVVYQVLRENCALGEIRAYDGRNAIDGNCAFVVIPASDEVRALVEICAFNESHAPDEGYVIVEIRASDELIAFDMSCAMDGVGLCYGAHASNEIHLLDVFVLPIRNILSGSPFHQPATPLFTDCKIFEGAVTNNKPFKLTVTKPSIQLRKWPAFTCLIMLCYVQRRFNEQQGWDLLCQVLFLRMKKGLTKGGDDYEDEDHEEPLIMNFPTSIDVEHQGNFRGKLLLSFFNGFEYCSSVTHEGDDIARLNHIKRMCYGERKMQEAAESSTPVFDKKGSKRGRSTPGTGDKTKKKLTADFSTVS